MLLMKNPIVLSYDKFGYHDQTFKLQFHRFYLFSHFQAISKSIQIIMFDPVAQEPNASNKKDIHCLKL